MDTNLDFPSFDIIFRSLNDFILKLVDDYHAKKIKSWDDLEAKVRVFFTKAQMDEMESMIPGWKKMSSYSDGITLTHIMCVFLGLFIMSEFQALTRAQQQLAKWIVLFHDTDKMHIKDKKDNLHAFRSAVLTATTLPRLGFLITPMYQTLINSWSQLTKYSATKDANNSETLIQDNSSLPKIVSGIDNLFGDETPSA
ncbi:MAG TPA: hypothetical protein DCX53_02910, partial [Anaerolineae bacterium]|nr:hypothetical protein [Anaerolineae bacterium]